MVYVIQNCEIPQLRKRFPFVPFNHVVFIFLYKMCEEVYTFSLYRPTFFQFILKRNNLRKL